jgi:hypothetical protein
VTCLVEGVVQERVTATLLNGGLDQVAEQAEELDERREGGVRDDQTETIVMVEVDDFASRHRQIVSAEPVDPISTIGSSVRACRAPALDPGVRIRHISIANSSVTELRRLRAPD